MYCNKKTDNEIRAGYPVIDKMQTGKKIRQMMEQRSLSVKDVKEYLSLASVQGIYLWLNGTTIPSVDNLYALSELFQVSMDDLICGSRKNTAADMDTLRIKQCRKRLELYYQRWIEQTVA